MYPGSKPHPFVKLCESWHCYTKTSLATCVDRKVASYEHRMRRVPLFDGWKAVHHLAIVDTSHRLKAREDGVLEWKRGSAEYGAISKLARRRDIKLLRLPRFGGVSHVLADGDLSSKGSTRPILQLTPDDARDLVMAVLSGHHVRAQPTTSANYPYDFSFPRQKGNGSSFMLPGAHPLILDRTWALFSEWTRAVGDFEAGPGTPFPRDVDGPLLQACWREARDGAAEEMGWETSGTDHVYEHYRRMVGDADPL